MKWLILTVAAPVLLIVVMVFIGALLLRDHLATRTATFRQTPDTVFAVVRDFAALPTWRSGLSAVELLPARDGVVSYREHSRHGAASYVVREELIGERLVVEIADEDLPYGGRWIFTFRATACGTELRITEEGFVKNVLFRFLARFVFGHASTVEIYLTDLAKKFGEPAPRFR